MANKSSQNAGQIIMARNAAGGLALPKMSINAVAGMNNTQPHKAMNVQERELDESLDNVDDFYSRASEQQREEARVAKEHEYHANWVIEQAKKRQEDRTKKHERRTKAMREQEVVDHKKADSHRGLPDADAEVQEKAVHEETVQDEVQKAHDSAMPTPAASSESDITDEKKEDPDTTISGALVQEEQADSTNAELLEELFGENEGVKGDAVQDHEKNQFQEIDGDELLALLNNPDDTEAGVEEEADDVADSIVEPQYAKVVTGQILLDTIKDNIDLPDGIRRTKYQGQQAVDNVMLFLDARGYSQSKIVHLEHSNGRHDFLLCSTGANCCRTAGKCVYNQCTIEPAEGVVSRTMDREEARDFFNTTPLPWMKAKMLLYEHIREAECDMVVSIAAATGRKDKMAVITVPFAKRWPYQFWEDFRKAQKKSKQKLSIFPAAKEFKERGRDGASDNDDSDDEEGDGEERDLTGEAQDQKQEGDQIVDVKPVGNKRARQMSNEEETAYLAMLKAKLAVLQASKTSDAALSDIEAQEMSAREEYVKVAPLVKPAKPGNPKKRARDEAVGEEKDAVAEEERPKRKAQKVNGSAPKAAPKPAAAGKAPPQKRKRQPEADGDDDSTIATEEPDSKRSRIEAEKDDTIAQLRAQMAALKEILPESTVTPALIQADDDHALARDTSNDPDDDEEETLLRAAATGTRPKKRATGVKTAAAAGSTALVEGDDDAANAATVSKPQKRKAPGKAPAVTGKRGRKASKEDEDEEFQPAKKAKRGGRKD